MPGISFCISLASSAIMGLAAAPVEGFVAEDVPVKKETRIRFPHFSVIIHDFNGYETSTDEGTGARTWYGQFGGGSDMGQARLNDEESEKEGYTETLIALKDTVMISEILFDDRINNTLFQVLPTDRTQSFRLSFCYLGAVTEVVDHRNYTRKVFKSIDHDKLFSAEEQTPYYTIHDSAKYFFRALPHTPDMVEVTVVNGEVVPKKMNSKEQLAWEQNQWETDRLRIKTKHGLHDTLVVIPGEYNTYVDLTKNRRLFTYGYISFLFRIECWKGRKLSETKFILVNIAYGC